MSMFEFNNSDYDRQQIASRIAEDNAREYVEKLVEAFKILAEVEDLAKGLPIAGKYLVVNCVIQTAKIKGKDFAVKLLFHPDSKKPLMAEIIKEVE